MWLLGLLVVVMLYLRHKSQMHRFTVHRNSRCELLLSSLHADLVLLLNAWVMVETSKLMTRVIMLLKRMLVHRLKTVTVVVRRRSLSPV